MFDFLRFTNGAKLIDTYRQDDSECGEVWSVMIDVGNDNFFVPVNPETGEIVDVTIISANDVRVDLQQLRFLLGGN